MCVERRNICGRIVQTSHSTCPSYSDYSSFFFSYYSYLDIPLFNKHLLRKVFHLFSILLAKFSTLFLLLFIVYSLLLFPLLARFLLLLFILHLKTSSPYPLFHSPSFYFCSSIPYSLHITLQELFALNRKEIPVKMWKFLQCETRFCKKRRNSI
jgi:hypothetical protein